MAEIQPKLTQLPQKTLKITHETSKDHANDAKWHAYVQKECEIPFNRFEDFVFEMRVFVCEELKSVRLMLFMDH